MRPRKIKPEKGYLGSKSSTYKSNEDRDLTYFIHDRVELMHQVFSIMKTKEIRSIVPNSVSDLSLRDLEELCLEELLGISSKRLCAILDGAEPPSDTDSSSQSDHQLETISLDSISSDEANLQLLQPKKIKHKHKHHKKKLDGKKKKIDDNASTEAGGSAEAEAGDTSRAADRAGMTVLELLELQARARAIRAQLALEQKLKEAAAAKDDKKDEKNVESDSSVEIKEEKPEVVELISSEDEQKPDVHTLNSSASASGQNKTVEKRADMVIIVPQNVQSKRKIKLNRTKALTPNSQERKSSEPVANESLLKEIDSNVKIQIGPKKQVNTDTDKEVLGTAASINLSTDDGKKKEKKKKPKQRRYKNAMDDGSDQDEITLQLSDSEKMDLLEDFDRKDYDNVSSSESESESSSSDELGVEKSLENKFEDAKLVKSKEKEQNVASGSSPTSVDKNYDTVQSDQNNENKLQQSIQQSQASSPSTPNVHKENEACADSEISGSNKNNDGNGNSIDNEAKDYVTSDNQTFCDQEQDKIIFEENISSKQDEGMLADTPHNINSQETDCCSEARKKTVNIISEPPIHVEHGHSIEEPKTNIANPISEFHNDLRPEKDTHEIHLSVTENDAKNHSTIENIELESLRSATIPCFLNIGSGKKIENLQIQIQNDNVNSQKIKSPKSDGEVTDKSSSDVEVSDKPDEIVCISDDDKPEGTVKKDKKKKKKKDKKNKQDKKSKKDKRSKKEKNQDFCEGSDQNYFELTKGEEKEVTACYCTEVSKNNEIIDISIPKRNVQLHSSSASDSVNALKALPEKLNTRADLGGLKALDSETFLKDLISSRTVQMLQKNVSAYVNAEDKSAEKLISMYSMEIIKNLSRGSIGSGHLSDLQSLCSDDSDSENIIEIDSDNLYEVLDISDDSSCFEVEGMTVLSEEPTTDEILALAAKIDELGQNKSKDLDEEQVIVLSPNHFGTNLYLEKKLDSKTSDLTIKEPTSEELMSESVEDIEREEVVTEDQIKAIELNVNEKNNVVNIDSQVEHNETQRLDASLSDDVTNLNDAIAKEHEIDKSLYPDKIILSNCGETHRDLDDVLHVSWKDRYLNSKKVKTVLSTANIFNALRKKNRDLKRKIEASKAQTVNEQNNTIIEPQETIIEGSIEHYKMLQGSSKYVHPVQDKKDLEKGGKGIESFIDTNDHPDQSSTKESGDADVLTTDMKKDAKQIMKMYKRLLKYNSLVKPSDRHKVKKKKIKKKQKEKNNVS